MKLYTAYRAPYPRRALMIIREKQIADVEIVNIDLMKEKRAPHGELQGAESLCSNSRPAA